MIINLWYDWIQIFDKKIYYVKKNKLEIQFPIFLKNLWLKKDIYIINWPWSFTTLRIWCIVLNTINYIYNFNINFYEINKIELFKKLYDKWLINSKINIYIWQEKNFLIYDFENNIFKIWNEDNIKDIDIFNYLNIDINDYNWNETKILKPYYFIPPNIQWEKVLH